MWIMGFRLQFSPAKIKVPCYSLKQEISYTHLTRGLEALALEGHAVHAAKVHNITEVGPRPLEPPVGQEPRDPAVDLLALGLQAAPCLVLPAGARRVAKHHEPVLALVRHDGLVGHGRVHGLAFEQQRPVKYIVGLS